MRAAFALTVAVVGPVLTPVTVLAWSPATHERIVDLALLLMPESLEPQLEKHRDGLRAGARAADLDASPMRHALHVDGSGGTLDRDVAEAVDRAVAIMRSRGSFAEFARELGYISHLVADAAFPLNTSASDPREDLYHDDFAAYVDSRLAKFPPVFDGYARMDDGFDVASYVRSVAERANRAYPRIGLAYFPDPGGKMRRSTTFDDRGPAFGTAQVSFVHALSATANVWLFVWRESRGNLADTPHYPPPRWKPGVTDRSRTP